MLASWAWSMDGKTDYWKLYEAVWTENCDEKYPAKFCNVFPWQSSLKLDHVEL
jgi:hypothetical protein